MEGNASGTHSSARFIRQVQSEGQQYHGLFLPSQKCQGDPSIVKTASSSFFFVDSKIFNTTFRGFSCCHWCDHALKTPLVPARSLDTGFSSFKVYHEESSWENSYAWRPIEGVALYMPRGNISWIQTRNKSFGHLQIACVRLWEFWRQVIIAIRIDLGKYPRFLFRAYVIATFGCCPLPWL